ncbi:DUF4262 domain-containing protein [Streptomyces sp. NPDC047072]|uniref:DUF4262 domain-containing protein n=1 Tax=Streptomyces sp. NPDC047072 TaxID=3154809 RepID=UPI0033EEDFFF
MAGAHESGSDSIQYKIREDVADQGWSWIWVFDPDASRPPFAYSIGFTATFGHPEVVVVGLPEDASVSVLQAVEAELAEGVRYQDGSSSDEILNGFPVRFQRVPEELSSVNLVQASNFYAGKIPSALQLIWPDRDGNYPGGPGTPTWLNDRQALGL